ncbi:U8-theraphotoxin-Hhn1f-like isoform X2 [Argiope bruennichi]|uniref:U8-theraphotoxin-Hhn1f like protein n=2 Tax=Argiope bruennichi TaxID=94029 RepID=A0A8T0E8U3_ARGBR|nr:U8-theraphotoxin-Hhn1f-like isoform X2 [Argiope bruennichi]KAF8767838.1 U8-theraphotoxin-Hhn1f like protein [Argiope bruennichi]
MVASVTADCGEFASCGDGACCAGSSYHRTCRPLSKNGMPCEPRHNGDQYQTACPCEEGLICSVIRRCQSANSLPLQ